MQSISDLLKVKEPKINILPRGEAIIKIADMVKYTDNVVNNRIRIARRLKYASVSDITKIYLAIQQGTIEWSKDYKSAFEQMCKRLPRIVKPKQNKLL